MVKQGSYIIEEMQSHYNQGWMELNFQDISIAVYNTSVELNMLSTSQVFILPFSAAVHLVHILNKIDVLYLKRIVTKIYVTMIMR